MGSRGKQSREGVFARAEKVSGPECRDGCGA